MKNTPPIPDPNLTTVDGAPVILLAEFENQERPFIGVWYDNKEWVPAAWHKDGTYLEDHRNCGLDLKISPASIQGERICQQTF